MEKSSKSISDIPPFACLALIYFLIHNVTNDLIYSPDAMILFILLLGYKDAKINQEDFEN